VIHCANCGSWFGAETGDQVFTQQNGGEDEFDEDIKIGGRDCDEI